MKEVTIYTDGACLGNPGPGGYASILIYHSHRKELSGSEKHTTNNRMEMMAVITALEALTEPCKVILYTDSRYIIDSVNMKWLEKWKAKNWMRAKSKPVLNTDLWKRMITSLDKHQVVFNWVKGHTGNPENERCDILAKSVAEVQRGL